MKKILSFALVLSMFFPVSLFACQDFNIVCGVKHGHPSSTNPRDWSIGYHHEKYKNAACRPDGGSHCGGHHVLHPDDMPHNSAKHHACYQKAKRRGSDGCSIKKVLSDPVSQIWAIILGPACRLHDVCYSVKGTSKKQCDKDLRNNFHAICNKLPVTPRAGRDQVFGRVNCRTIIPSWTSSSVFDSKEMRNAWRHNQQWAKRNCP